MKVCRACKGDQLYLFLPLGCHPLANGFLRPEQLVEDEPSFPLDTYVCLACGLIQIRDNIPPGFFRNYVYVPSTAATMHDHFRHFAGAVAGRFLTSPQSLTVDIGCNDGLFLKCLKDRGARTLGVDPATNIVEMAREKGLEVLNEYFAPKIARSIRESYGPADVIVTTNTLHHIGDPDPFMEGVAALLSDTGVLIVEVPHALEIVQTNQFDGIYHEHVSQMTVTSLVDLFRRFGLELFDVERLEVHGGSMRAFARRSGECVESPAVAGWLSREAAGGLFRASTYDRFRGRVEQIKAELLGMLAGLKAQGRRIVGYGASARGNTLLNYCGIGTDVLEYLVDKNPLKHGLHSPGMHIRVFPTERILENPPDYVLILAWNFAEEIIRQQDAYRRTGGQFILPIPEPRVVS